LRKEKIAAVAVAALVVGAGAYFYWGAVGQRNGSTSSHNPRSILLIMEVANSLYYAVEVTDDIVFAASGYSYLKNGSVTFIGVKFQTLCPASILGCPNPGHNGTQTGLGYPGAYLKFTMTFPDGKSEGMTKAWGNTNYSPFLSTHTKPRAGILVEYVTGPSAPRAFLLVSPYMTPFS